MRRNRVPIAEKRVIQSMTNHNSAQRKATPLDQKLKRNNFSVSMVNTRSAKENKTKVSAVEGRTEPAIEIDLETPDQSVDEAEKKKNGVNTDCGKVVLVRCAGEAKETIGHR